MKRILTRVEGEGSILVVEKDGYVDSVVYEISETPRFFEYFVSGLSPERVVEIVSRICGICGTSYNFVASINFEKCLGVDVDPELLSLKEVLHLIERVKSHVLHLFHLNLPDLVKTKSVIEFLRRNPQISKDALNVLLWSRKAMEVFGGRMHNVVNMRVGGVYRLPDRVDVERISKELNNVIKSFMEFSDFVLTLKPPELPLSNGFKVHEVSLYVPTHEYPHHSDKVCIDGKVYTLSEFYGGIVKYLQVPYSTAIHCRVGGVESYVVGPYSRFNQFYSRLSKEVRDYIGMYGWRAPLSNILYTYVARIAETYEALLQIQKFLDTFKPTQIRSPTINVKGEVVCEYAVEAPRGILYHKYVVRDGRIVSCDIIAPTTQNIAAMNDIATNVLRGKKVDEEVVDIAKKIAVSFDPCISCSVHTLPVKIIHLETLPKT